MSKSILFISPFYPDNSESPRHRAVYNHINYFKSKNYKIDFIYLSNSEIDIDIEFTRLSLPSISEVLKNIILQLLSLKKISLQSSLFYSNSISKYLKKINSNNKYDVIFFESIRTAPYQEVFQSTYKILDLGDLISRRYGLLRTSKIKVNNVLGQFSNQSSFLNIMLKNFFVQKIILFTEEKLIKRMEIDSVKFFDKIILVSQYEQSLLNKYSNKANVHWIPNIDFSQSSNNPKFTLNKSLSFYGILNNPHNEHALIYFFENIFKKIIDKDSDIDFKIIGKNPTDQIVKFANQFSDNVILKGYVDDIESNIKDSNLLIVPIMAGSGVKTKVLDSICWGVPVVSSMEGVSGMINIEESGVMLANNVDDFVNNIFKIINDKDFASECSEKSLQYYKKYYSKHAIHLKYNSMIIH
jgi:glycosyltransferase involved in cell wall biosynthesis